MCLETVHQEALKRSLWEKFLTNLVPNANATQNSNLRVYFLDFLKFYQTKYPFFCNRNLFSLPKGEIQTNLFVTETNLFIIVQFQMINSIVLLMVVQNGILNDQPPLLFKYHLLLTKLANASTEEWAPLGQLSWSRELS